MLGHFGLLSTLLCIFTAVLVFVLASASMAFAAEQRSSTVYLPLQRHARSAPSIDSANEELSVAAQPLQHATEHNISVSFLGEPMMPPSSHPKELIQCIQPSHETGCTDQSQNDKASGDEIKGQTAQDREQSAAPASGLSLASSLPIPLDPSTAQWLYNMSHFAALAYSSTLLSLRSLSCQQNRTIQDSRHSPSIASEFLSVLNMISWIDRMVTLSPPSLFPPKEPSDYIADCQIYGIFTCDSGSRQGFIAVHEKQQQILLVFRGSINLANYMDSLNFYKVPLEWASSWAAAQGIPFSSLPLVHSGYLKAYLVIRPGLQSMLRELLVSHPAYAGYSLLFIGHSFGGVLSVLAALDYAVHCRNRAGDPSFASRKAQVVTIGCPRIGDALFAQFYHFHFPNVNATLRVVMGGDPVPHLLFSPWLGFAHVGREIWIRRGRQEDSSAQAQSTNTALFCNHGLALDMEDPNCSASLSVIDWRLLDHVLIWNISIMDYLLKC